MENCCSSEVRSGPTVKLTLRDGKLREFMCSVTASRVLEESPGCFVCDSDEMEFGSIFSEVDGDEELPPDQLYFVLLKVSLHCPILPAEMAGKASLALDMGDGGVICSCLGRSKIDPSTAPTPCNKEMGDEHISMECASGGCKDCSGREWVGAKATSVYNDGASAWGELVFLSNLSIIQD
ncbi:hypothetical protein MLD38_023362 [Melastoma candidum]|uniref:Uncharacterized protein n=1 Tax=Melastoma candidum TaxID=119954 RepID=A0ACB9QMA1_9MYRT|nr:hypothetical protein MLD38_023362 [Melastoma candidum]